MYTIRNCFIQKYLVFQDNSEFQEETLLLFFSFEKCCFNLSLLDVSKHPNDSGNDWLLVSLSGVWVFLKNSEEFHPVQNEIALDN